MIACLVHNQSMRQSAHVQSYAGDEFHFPKHVLPVKNITKINTLILLKHVLAYKSKVKFYDTKKNAFCLRCTFEVSAFICSSLTTFMARSLPVSLSWQTYTSPKAPLPNKAPAFQFTGQRGAIKWYINHCKYVFLFKLLSFANLFWFIYVHCIISFINNLPTFEQIINESINEIKWFVSLF